MPTIGIDFGNMFSFPCFVENMDVQARRGGVERILLPSENRFNSGIPTCYFYSAERGERFGMEAANAAPRDHQRKLLKRRLLNDEKRGFPAVETIDGKEIRYDEVVTKMIQYIVRKANDVMRNEYRQTSNEISLAYPVDFLHSHMQHLIELAEKATLEDGRHVKVVGTIAEPAAAALCYLCAFPPEKDNVNVVVYDLGGGTLDVASITAYPNGVMRNGTRKYYDVLAQDGARIGGYEFDRLLEEIAFQKMKSAPTGQSLASFRMRLEEVKKNLDTQEEDYLEVSFDESITLTKAEFETAAKPLIRQTLDVMEGVLNRQEVPRPELVIMTGGQSQMPLIRKMLLERFSYLRGDQVILYKPQTAIAFGAARYGILEPLVQKRNKYALGVRVYKFGTDKKYIDVLIPEGSLLPTPENERRWKTYHTRTNDKSHVRCSVFEAVRSNADPLHWETDFRETMSIRYDFGRIVPRNTRFEVQLYVDNKDLVHVLVRMPGKSQTVKEEKVQLENFK